MSTTKPTVGKTGKLNSVDSVMVDDLNERLEELSGELGDFRYELQEMIDAMSKKCKTSEAGKEVLAIFRAVDDAENAILG